MTLKTLSTNTIAKLPSSTITTNPTPSVKEPSGNNTSYASITTNHSDKTNSKSKDLLTKLLIDTIQKRYTSTDIKEIIMSALSAIIMIIQNSNNSRIIYWNCRGASKKRLELLELVQRKNIDIILLNETHLNNSQQFKLPNFHSYITNRPQRLGHPAWGGTANNKSKKSFTTRLRSLHHQLKIPQSKFK
ncbi:unnamed protein product [Macrosiphum euphorbiae]|uniref:Endonuclease/exonuclease/phosphatase domain-containing protein n=1 Tax=Macrosiphum euphorbiae TaxID=13131 RepID=A0AAV0Y7F3_9HEMI|nr:unnamed protein product [Macrosiphum euphorbiae]